MKTKDIQIKYRLFFFWNFDREERWLNRMADEGYDLEHAFFCRYVFRKGKPGGYRYKLELMEQSPHSEKGRQYLDFLEETGVEVICTYQHWAYLRQPSERGPFALYSDLASRIKYLDRVMWAILPLMLLCLFCGIVNLGYAGDEGIVCNGMVNLAGGVLCLLAAAGFLRGLFRLRKKKQELEKKRGIEE